MVWLQPIPYPLGKLAEESCQVRGRTAGPPLTTEFQSFGTSNLLLQASICNYYRILLLMLNVTNRYEVELIPGHKSILTPLVVMTVYIIVVHIISWSHRTATHPPQYIPLILMLTANSPVARSFTSCLEWHCGTLIPGLGIQWGSKSVVLYTSTQREFTPYTSLWRLGTVTWTVSRWSQVSYIVCQCT